MAKPLHVLLKKLVADVHASIRSSGAYRIFKVKQTLNCFEGKAELLLV